MKELLCFAGGFFLARFLAQQEAKKKYVEKEKKVVDEIQNKLHDLIQTIAPSAPDEKIAEAVISVTETGQHLEGSYGNDTEIPKVEANSSSPSQVAHGLRGHGIRQGVFEGEAYTNSLT